MSNSVLTKQLKKMFGWCYQMRTEAEIRLHWISGLRRVARNSRPKLEMFQVGR